VEVGVVLVLAVETSTPQTTVSIGNEQGVIGSVLLSWSRGHSEIVTPAINSLLDWSELRLSQVGGVAVGVGPGLFTGLRVGVATARALAQVLMVPLVGIGSLDVLAFPARHSRWRIGAVSDAKRGEVFYAFYRPVPGGVARETEVAVGSPERLAAELEASGEEHLLVGGGALLYRRTLREVGTPLEFASFALAFPNAEALLELALPRLHREEYTRPEEVVPYYVRKSDAKIDWARAGRVA
jgi:tRNA threonylcarbamoyladenosine biosynthesis protein TsaB